MELDEQYLTELRLLLQLLTEFGVAEYSDKARSLRLTPPVREAPPVPTFDNSPITDDEREILGLPPLPRKPGSP